MHWDRDLWRGCVIDKWKHKYKKANLSRSSVSISASVNTYNQTNMAVHRKHATWMRCGLGIEISDLCSYTSDKLQWCLPIQKALSQITFILRNRRLQSHFNVTSFTLILMIGPEGRTGRQMCHQLVCGEMRLSELLHLIYNSTHKFTDRNQS